jgi:putative N6-adenine-specific DNA methylase
MAEKHRFKKNREFKQRLDEQEENENSDIRSFTFHKHEMDSRDSRKPRSSREPRERDSRDFKDSRKSRDFRENKNRGGHERFDRSGGKRNKRFHHDDE